MISNRLDLKSLRQFVAVAELGGFTQASRRLHIAQPALSVSIRKLEASVGVALFRREARGVSLTPAGVAALDEAQRVLVHAARFAEAAQAVSRGAGGTLKVGFVGSATYGLLPRILPDFRDKFPGVELVLRETTTSQAIKALDQQEIDIGLVRTPLGDSYAADLVELQADRLIVALPPSHPKAVADLPVDLADLADEGFVMYTSAGAPGIRSAAMLTCQQAGFAPRIVQEATQVATVLALVESGLGVGLVPAVTATFTMGRVAFRPLREPFEAARVGLSLACFRDRLTPAADRFLCSALQSCERDTPPVA